MAKSVIKRFISDAESFEIIKNDFRFLVDKIKISGFEYDLQIRENRFNLYYKGNSIGEISYKKSRGQYDVIIHHKFINDKIREGFNPSKRGDYLVFRIPRNRLHSFYSSQNLTAMSGKVKKVNFQEEIIFEQMLITDNMNRQDLIIIDRQITDKLTNKKADLLALIKKNNSDYQFCVLEVKLGNNKELSGKVASQLSGYVSWIEKHFDDYKNCYDQNILQKRQLDLIRKPAKINIVRDVIGAVVVLGYSGIAEKSIKELKQKYPSIKIIQFKNRISLKDLN